MDTVLSSISWSVGSCNSAADHDRGQVTFANTFYNRRPVNLLIDSSNSTCISRLMLYIYVSSHTTQQVAKLGMIHATTPTSLSVTPHFICTSHLPSQYLCKCHLEHQTARTVIPTQNHRSVPIFARVIMVQSTPTSYPSLSPLASQQQLPAYS